MWTLLAVIGGLLLGSIIGFAVRKYIAESKIGSAEKEAERIINDAEKEAESIERE
ncbi:MAG: Rnase Y domain-containing protein, partial [Halanaerobacter sp.]